jgi:dGTP triphosphohydrolase
MEKLAALNYLSELFLHFSDDRSRCLLADFDPATRESPVFIAWRSVEKYVAGMKDDRGGTNLESLTLKIE